MKLVRQLTTVIAISIYSLYAQNYKYGNVALGGGGFVSGIITCPKEKNLMYARTDVGGAYRWDEANKVWIPLLDWVNESQVGYMGVEALAIDPSSPSKVYMLAGISYFNGGKTAILKSNDYGATFAISEVTTQFKAHGNGAGRQNGERLAVDPNKGSILFCGSRANGLFKSIDAGLTWSNVASFPVTTTANGNGACIVLFDKSTGSVGNATQTIYVGVSRMGSDNMYVSKDGGNTWAALAGQTNTYMPQRAVLASDGNLIITYGNGAGPGGGTDPMSTGAIWKFNTKTNAWTNITPSVASAYGGISVDASNPQKLVATTINKYLQQPWGWGDRIFVSNNGGTSWTDMFASNKFTMDKNGIAWINGAIHWAGSIEIDPYNPDRFFVASGNGIFMTDNLSANVATLKFMCKGLEETVPRDIVNIEGGPTAWVMFDYDGCVQTDIKQYVQTNTPHAGTSTGIDYAGKKSAYMVRVGSNIYYTNNSGGLWTAFATKPNDNTAFDQGKVAVSADGAVVLWCPNGQAVTYRTTNNGTSWTTVNGLNINNCRPTADKTNPNKFYAYEPGTGNIYISTDAGVSFSIASKTNTGGQNIMRNVPGIEGDIWIPLNGNGLVRSTNSGTTFTKISTVTTCRSVGFGKAAPGKPYLSVYIWGTVGGVTGIFRSDDVCATWTRLNDDAHEWGGPGNGEFVIGDLNVYGRFLMSSAGRGVVYGEPNATVITETESDTQAENIFQAFPNPFTTHLQINSKGKFRYAVSNIEGEEIENGEGENSITMGWDFQAGIYLLKIELDNKVIISKIIKQ